MRPNSLIINNWQQGIADSPFLGFGNMKMVDIELFPGSVKCQKKPTALFHTPLSAAFTADPATDICTLTSGTISETGVAVTLTTTGTLPTGLATSTTYFIIKLTSSTFYLATTLQNANASTAINITGAGSGTHTITTINPGTIRHIVKDQRTDTLFMQDSNGRVWYPGGGTYTLLNGNTLTNAAGNGLVIFSTAATLAGSATYLLAFRNAAIDIVNIYSTANRENPSWSNSWQSLNSGAGSGNSHHVIQGQDQILYFCDDKYVGSIKENLGFTFDPSSGSSFTFNNQALDFPAYEIAQCLEELGTYLLIGGKNSNKIYPWDRLSSSYALPIDVPERQILRMKNSGGMVYILAGTNGNIYTTQGSYVNLFKKIPAHIYNASATIQSNPVTWGGIALRNGALLIGLSGLTSGNSGVFLLFPDGRLTMDNIPLSGSANVTAIYAETDHYTFGYSAGAAAISDASSRYSDGSSVIESEFYQLGTKTSPVSFATCEIQLASPTTGSVEILYRRDRTSSFTSYTTFTLDGSTLSFESDVGSIENIENIQFQLKLIGSVELKEVRFLA